MASTELVKLEKEKQKGFAIQASTELVKELLNNPILDGFALLALNHALYKTGWYESDATIHFGFLGMSSLTPEAAAINMHDSIALFIMACSIAFALKQGSSLGNIKGVLS